MLASWDVCGKDEAEYLEHLARDVRELHTDCACVEVAQ